MDISITFEEYCKEKKIDANAFKKKEPLYYDELSSFFMKVHPLSFTEQKKFIINKIRRKYILKESASK